MVAVVAADALVATEHEEDEKSATPAMGDATGSDKASQSERSHLSLLENKQSRRCCGTIISNVYARCGGSWLIAASDKRIVTIAAAPTTQGGNLGLSHSIEVDTPPFY